MMKNRRKTNRKKRRKTRKKKGGRRRGETKRIKQAKLCSLITESKDNSWRNICPPPAVGGGEVPPAAGKASALSFFKMEEQT